MWVFAGGMQRSASTLQYQIASELVERSKRGQRLGWRDQAEHDDFFRENAGRFEYLVFKCHVLTPPMKAEIDAGHACALYIFRDVRDVVSSLKQKMDANFEDAQLVELTRRLIHRFQVWTSLPKVHVARYEEVIQDISREVDKIAKFLDIACHEETIREIADMFSMQKQKQRIGGFQKSDALVRINKNNIFDSNSLLHLNHIQDGRCARYKDNLSEHEIEIIQTQAGKWLREMGYISV